MDLPALLLTLRLAAATTLILLSVAAPLALWISGRDTFASRAVQAAVAVPLILPPTVLGFYLLVGLGPLTAVGRALIRAVGHPLSFTFSGVLLGSLVYSLPFAVQPLVSGFRAVDPALVGVARTLGCTPHRAFLRVTLPLAKGSFVTAAVLVFAHTVGEFGVVLMVGGDIPGVTRTLSIALYDQVEGAEFAAANHLALLLVGLSFTALLLLYGTSFRPQTKRGRELE